MSIIFLDFDGVISTSESKWHLDPEKVALVEQIISATDAKIVVSSSWRGNSKSREEFISKLFNRYKRLTECISEDSLFIKSIYDVTDRNGSARGDEIQRWLDAHDKEVDTYVILDDDGDMLDNQLLCFVQTDGWEGITSREVKLAIQVLKNEKVINPIRMNHELIWRWRLKRSQGIETNIMQLLAEYDATH